MTKQNDANFLELLAKTAINKRAYYVCLRNTMETINTQQTASGGPGLCNKGVTGMFGSTQACIEREGPGNALFNCNLIPPNCRNFQKFSNTRPLIEMPALSVPVSGQMTLGFKARTDQVIVKQTRKQ